MKLARSTRRLAQANDTPLSASRTGGQTLIKKPRFAHTNLIAKNWRALARFYRRSSVAFKSGPNGTSEASCWKREPECPGPIYAAFIFGFPVATSPAPP